MRAVYSCLHVIDLYATAVIGEKVIHWQATASVRFSTTERVASLTIQLVCFDPWNVTQYQAFRQARRSIWIPLQLGRHSMRPF